MATNPYFSSNYYATTKDQVLIDNLIVESIKIYGIDVKYIPRTFINYDQLLGEDQSSLFDNYYTIEMYVKSLDGFEGDGGFISKFGFEIRDEISLTVSKTRWNQLISGPTPPSDLNPRPMEGDIILLPTIVDKAGRLFEIYYVNREEIYYQLGNLYTYELKCRVWEQAGETFNTGDLNIDSYSDFISTTTYRMTNGFGNFTIGEIVKVQGKPEIKAEVVSWDQPNRYLEIRNQVGDMQIGMSLVGQTSNAEFDIISVVSIIDQIQADVDNNIIEENANEILDFNEKNPFVS